MLPFCYINESLNQTKIHNILVESCQMLRFVYIYLRMNVVESCNKRNANTQPYTRYISVFFSLKFLHQIFSVNTDLSNRTQ